MDKGFESAEFMDIIMYSYSTLLPSVMPFLNYLFTKKKPPSYGGYSVNVFFFYSGFFTHLTDRPEYCEAVSYAAIVPSS